MTIVLPYFRSSSIGTLDMCEVQFFIRYLLGYPSKPNKKADMGTIVHYVQEVLAKCKLEMQNHPKKKLHRIKTEVGELSFDKSDLYKKTTLTDKEVDIINKSRNLAIYTYDVDIPYGHQRMGREFVNTLFDKVYKKYEWPPEKITKKSEVWDHLTYRDCLNWTWIANEKFDGEFDPRNNNIYAVEQFFDVELKRDWAKQGDEYLRIKGTIDVILRPKEDTIIVQDYKTGERMNWNSMERKTYAKLSTDPQLLLYYYICKKFLFPDIPKVLVTIFFIRDGGPFTICFSEADLHKAELFLREKFNKAIEEEPLQLRDFSRNNLVCKYLCAYKDNKFNEDEEHDMCWSTYKTCKTHDKQTIINRYRKEGFSPSYYKKPGDNEE